MSAQSPPATNVFDAAKAIVESLKGLDKEHQEQAIRFASESLGLRAPSKSESPIQTGQSPSATHHPRPMDIRSFVEEKAPKSDMQYAAVIAYYYRFEAPENQRRDSVDANVLEESTRHANWKRLARPHATLNNATAQGYLDRAGRGEFRISTVGENLVAMTLPGGNEAASGPRRQRRTRKKPQSKKGPAKKGPRKKRSRKSK